MSLDALIKAVFSRTVETLPTIASMKASARSYVWSASVYRPRATWSAANAAKCCGTAEISPLACVAVRPILRDVRPSPSPPHLDISPQHGHESLRVCGAARLFRRVRWFHQMTPGPCADRFAPEQLMPNGPARTSRARFYARPVHERGPQRRGAERRRIV